MHSPFASLCRKAESRRLFPSGIYSYLEWHSTGPIATVPCLPWSQLNPKSLPHEDMRAATILLMLSGHLHTVLECPRISRRIHLGQAESRLQDERPLASSALHAGPRDCGEVGGKAPIDTQSNPLERHDIIDREHSSGAAQFASRFFQPRIVTPTPLLNVLSCECFTLAPANFEGLWIHRDQTEPPDCLLIFVLPCRDISGA